MPGKGKPFKKGSIGRPKGATNLLTRTVKDTVLNVFMELQGDEKHNLKAFAEKHPKDFYIIASKLIPTEVNANIQTNTIKVKVPGEKESEE
jgi:hypothetical protein